MRLTHLYYLGPVFASLLAACDPNTVPPTVAEPAEGLTQDRCLVRVRINTPGDRATYGPGLQEARGNSEGAIVANHAGWRVNGGEVVDVLDTNESSVPNHDEAPIVFSAKLVPGPNLLEIGRCNAVNTCGWTPVNITVEQRRGSPDCSAFGSGQLVVPPNVGAPAWLEPLDQGRVLVLVSRESRAAFAVLRRDGRLDPSYGTQGFQPLPIGLGQVTVVPAAFEKRLILSTLSVGAAWLARANADGSSDTTFGNAGSLALGTSTGGRRLLGGLAALGDSTYVVSGAQVDETIENQWKTQAFVLRVDEDGKELSFVTIGEPVERAWPVMAMDQRGRAYFAWNERLVRATKDGVDSTFGTDGAVVLPPNDRARAVVASGDWVIVRDVWHENGQSQGRALYWGKGRFGETSGTITLTPRQGSCCEVPPFAVGHDETFWFTDVEDGTADPANSWLMDRASGGTRIVVRKYAPATGPDTAWGDQGVSRLGFELAWNPVSVEPLDDLPVRMSVDRDGAPWIVGTSVVAGAAQQNAYTKRGPGATIAKLLP